MRAFTILRRATALGALSLCPVLVAAPPVLAQAIERNLPPAPQAEPQALAPPNAIPASQDDRPLGPTLKGLILLGPTDVVRTAPVSDVVPGLVPRINTPKGWATLRPFLNRPMSRRLIAEVEAAIARYYHGAGFPFVSVSTPPQVIGGGVLQIRVVEFRAGIVAVSGAKPAAAIHIRKGVRLQSGQPVDARRLSADLDWLNRYPFHHVEAVFSAGDALGRTDLDLLAASEKPWQVYAGYANSGSHETGQDRYLLGAQAGGLLGAGSLVSYQFTASPDLFDDHGAAFGSANHPEYLSHGLRAAIPIAPRQEIEASFDHVETNSVTDPFRVRQITDELSLGYRTSLSNFSSLPGDLSLGLEGKTEQHKTYFTDIDVLNGTVEVYQLYLGWSSAWSDPAGRNSLSLTLHDSPGRVNGSNSPRALDTFSNGRTSAVAYQYLNAEFSRTTHLPGHWSLSDVVIGQWASAPLPDTEQMGVGGADLVRGYSLDDGAYDNAVVSRNELHAPTFEVSGAGVRDALSPFAFLDVGYGVERVIRHEVHPASFGFGAYDQLGSHLSLDATAAYVIDKGVLTHGGLTLQTKATLSF